MPLDNAKNGARATLAAGITMAATSISLTAGHGSRMPSVPFNAWIYNSTDFPADPHDDPMYEIVRVTARSTDTLTITRAQESTSASDHNAVGKTYRLVAGLTARTINAGLVGEFYNAKGYGLVGDGVTDDTAALQTLIDQLSLVGGGRIYFPPGTYLIAGALQDTAVRNAQILLPIVPTAQPPVTIEFCGALAPPRQFFIDTPMPSPSGYSIIKSTLAAGSGTSAAFIAGKEATSNYWDNVQLIVRNIIFEAPPNPQFTVFNCYNLMGPCFYNVLIHCGSLSGTGQTEPTHTNSVAIRLAPLSHSAGQQVEVVDIWGFYTGLLDGELAELHLNVWLCKNAITVPFTYHPSTYRHLGIFGCARGITAAGVGWTGLPGDNGTHYMRVNVCSIERTVAPTYGPAWAERVYDIDDPSNLLKGDLKWQSILAGSGNDHSFVKNGGTGLLTAEIGS